MVAGTAWRSVSGRRSGLLMAAGLGLGMMAFGTYLSVRPMRAPGVSVPRARAHQGTMVVGLAATGWWRRSPPLPLRAPWNGTLNWLPHAGQRAMVGHGQSLCSVVPPFFKLSLGAAYESWKAAQAAVTVAKRQLAMQRTPAEANLQSARQAWLAAADAVQQRYTRVLRARAGLKTVRAASEAPTFRWALGTDLRQATRAWDHARAELAAAVSRYHTAGRFLAVGPVLAVYRTSVVQDLATARAAKDTWDILRQRDQPLQSPAQGRLRITVPSSSFVTAGQTLGVVEPKRTPVLPWKGFVTASLASRVHAGERIVWHGRTVGKVRYVTRTIVRYRGHPGVWFYGQEEGTLRPKMANLPQPLEIVTRRLVKVVLIPRTAYFHRHGQGGVYLHAGRRWIFHPVSLIAVEASQAAVDGPPRGSLVALKATSRG